MTWEGNIFNRFAENCKDCDKIEVGTGVTEFMYSDRNAYEVVEVTDQKHVSIRELGHKMLDENGYGSNNWELYSDESNPIIPVVKRGKYWYIHNTIKAENFSDTPDSRLYLAMHDISWDDLQKRKVINRYSKMNIKFGVADYYYDWEF